MDLSLDELIKSKRSTSRGGRRGGGRQGGSRGGGVKRGGGGGGGSNFRSNGAGGGGGGPIRRGRPMARRSNGFSPYSKGDVNGSWTHDMYEGPKRQQMRGGLSTTNIHKIVISNLDFGVTSTDIQELFDEFGPLKTATVHYDRSGRSLGTADVVFDSKNAALKAVRQYNNVPLDGRPMKIELATDLSTVANLATRLSRPAQLPVRGTRGGVRGNRGNTRGGRGNIRGNSRGRGGGSSRGGRNNEKKMPNKDELDAQLDSFIKSKNN
ncbi:THO complex subunit 4 [Acyrthosiphon pisum]|uniref:ACYPI006176 protein n=1 Tax=Acyrthosiphon pisum TaxID=7029 RepID=C4WSF5_ACYPI|nr:THO complex subunit 4 [Acyrthosiphon pisum]BAH70825.1 ACYPI006176 [Acyrthosiphon pisum]|eukprot:NP_001155655.1 THO complex subunit 4 [Acyrthosiphon pisum]